MSSILVIEDEEIVLEPLCDLLRHENFNVFSATNGEDGLKIAQEIQPDLILCDIMLPGMDGYGVLSSVRKSPGTAHIPFIFLTARVERADMRRGMELGADDYLCKPVPKKDMINAIRTRLDQKKNADEMLNRRLESVSRDIAAVISHELLTPLTGIVGFSELLTREIETPEREVSTKYLQESVTRLNYTVRHLLDYSNLRLLLDQPENIKELREQGALGAEVAAVIKPAAMQLAMAYNRLPDLRLVFNVSRFPLPTLFLDLVTMQLVSNAFKFSKAGNPVTITVQQKSDWAEFRVEDKGIGMPNEHIRQFGPFRQFDRDRHEHQGLGLGLEMVRLVSVVFDCKLEVQSTEGHGTTITLSCPLARS